MVIAGKRTDHLAWLDEAAKDGKGVRWMSRRELCVFDPGLARSVLRNEIGGIARHSDFFGPLGAAFGPREEQILLAREAHALLQAHRRTLDIPAFVGRLERRSLWPRAGYLLLLEMMRPLLAAPGRSPAFHGALDRLVANGILARFDRPAGPIRRSINRFRFANAVVREAADATPGEPRRDILELLAARGHKMGDEMLVHLYAAFVFSVVSSVGLTLAWSLLLAIRHGRTSAPPRHIVQEALRLYPITWLLERNAEREIEIGGERVGPSCAIVVSPYALHRNALHWPEPDRFLPERWSGRIDRRAWMPFGAGSQSCVAASLSIDLAADALAALLAVPVAIEAADERPSIGAALAPGRFTLLRGQGSGEQAEAEEQQAEERDGNA
jgi:hypothetical protein